MVSKFFVYIYLCFCNGLDEEEEDVDEVTAYLSAVGSWPLAIFSMSSVIAAETLLVYPPDLSVIAFGQ